MSKSRVYIAGPYSGDCAEEVDSNIAAAREALADLFRKGYVPFCPHTMTAEFERRYPDIPYETYIETDLEWLRHCDYIYLLPRWEKSRGSLGELEEALRLGIKVLNVEAIMEVLRRG